MQLVFCFIFSRIYGQLLKNLNLDLIKNLHMIENNFTNLFSFSISAEILRNAQLAELEII